MDEPDFFGKTAPYWLMAAGSLLWLSSRVRSGRPLVKYELRRPVPWNGLAMAAVVVLFMFLPSAIFLAARDRFTAGLEPAAQAEFAALEEGTKPTFPGYAVTILKADCAGKLIGAALVVAFLAGVFRADGRDLGLSLHRFGRNLRLGLLAFFIITPPVMVLQASLIHFTGFEYDHPLIVGLRDRSNRDILYWSLITAIVVAPLVEELFFRGLLQGWLERAVVKFQTSLNAEQLRAYERPTTDNPLLADPQLAATHAPIPMPGPSHIPNVITSILFGLAHWGPGSGPAPFVLFVFSLGLGYLYRQTHSIWPGTVVHFLLNSLSMAMLLSEAAKK